MIKSLVMVLTMVAMSSLVSAKTKRIVKLMPLPAPPTFDFMTEEQYQKDLKAAKAGTRRVADIDKVNDIEALSDSLKNLRSALIGGPLWKNKKVDGDKTLEGIKNANDLVSLIQNLEGKDEKNKLGVDLSYDKLDADAKFVAAQLIAMKPFQSAVYRLRHLIDKAELSKAAIVTMLRVAATGQNVFFPAEENKAAFDYLLAPTAGMGPDISDDEELHNYFVTEVVQAANDLYVRINDLKFTAPVYFDNKMIYSSANFVSDDDRYSVLGETERLASLSGVAFYISSLCTSIGYNWIGMFETADSLAQAYGFRAAMGWDINSRGTAESRTKIIRRNSELFTLRPGGENWTRRSYDWFTLGVRLANITWAGIKSDGAKGANLNKLIDPRGLLPFTRQIDSTLTTLDALIDSEPVSSAVVQGEAVEVKFKELFTNPPKDLKVFLPTGFDSSGDQIPSRYAREDGKYRNYLNGTPNAWCIKSCKDSSGKELLSYGHYFPKVKTNADVKMAARVLNQTWGGWLVGMPLGAMMF